MVFLCSSDALCVPLQLWTFLLRAWLVPGSVWGGHCYRCFGSGFGDVPFPDVFRVKFVWSNWNSMGKCLGMVWSR